jgi:hypothetical protein
MVAESAYVRLRYDCHFLGVFAPSERRAWVRRDSAFGGFSGGRAGASPRGRAATGSLRGAGSWSRCCGLLPRGGPPAARRLGSKLAGLAGSWWILAPGTRPHLRWRREPWRVPGGYVKVAGAIAWGGFQREVRFFDGGLRRRSLVDLGARLVSGVSSALWTSGCCGRACSTASEVSAGGFGSSSRCGVGAGLRRVGITEHRAVRVGALGCLERASGVK